MWRWKRERWGCQDTGCPRQARDQREDISRDISSSSAPPASTSLRDTLAPPSPPVEFRVHPLEWQLAVAALGALAGLAALAAGLLPERSRPRAGRALDAAMAVLALAGGFGLFVLSAQARLTLKTWDVEHAYLGAKYASELGYFRIYACMLALDEREAGHFRAVDAASDLRQPSATLGRAQILRASDCEERFTPERRREFLADLAFFQGLPDQPNRALWFADNGYNQTPFFTALAAPVFERLPRRHGALLALTLLDPALIALALAAAIRCFGPRAGLVAATFFLSAVPNQWNVMGGSILRYGYASLAILGFSAFARGRARAAGAAFGLATLLQVFPAVLPGALALSGLDNRRRGERLPEWLPRLAVSFAATVAAGLLVSGALVGIGAWREFLAKIALHGQILSLYRIGLKCVVALDHFLASAPDYDYAAAVASLQARAALHAAAAAVLGLAVLGLVRRVGALAFAATALAAVLFALTPVHYYFSVLVLMLLAPLDAVRSPAYAVTWTALFAWSAAGYAALLATDSRAFTNSAVLSAGLLAVLATHAIAWWAAAPGFPTRGPPRARR